jgi:hypothetical protein
MRRSDVHSATRGSVRNTASIDGTKWTVVTALSTMSPRRYPGSLWPPGAASTSRAPVTSGQKNSHTDTSKLVGVFCRTTSVGPSGWSFCIQSSRFTMARWLTTTPFGWPVEPDV